VSVRYLLDSNVISEPTRSRANAGVVRALLEHVGEVGIATVVWHELLFGWERLPDSLKKRTIGDYLFQVVSVSMSILPYDQKAAEWHARERVRLTAIGKTPPLFDGQIAAIAKVNGLILVTANRRHFEPFEDLPIEDWRE
jgi:tRNA(fMet)-specific endonuclease VapC